MIDIKKYLVENYGRIDISVKEMSLETGYAEGSIRVIASKLKLKRGTSFEEYSNEVWISLSELCFSKYYISNYGRIKNSDDKLLVSNPHHQSGYPQTRLMDDEGCKKTIINHRIEAKLFLPNFNEDLQVDHVDRNRSNNYIANLRMVNPKENANNQKAPASTTRFLKEEEVRDICIQLENGRSISEIVSSNSFYTKSKVEKIKQGIRWILISSEYKI